MRGYYEREWHSGRMTLKHGEDGSQGGRGLLGSMRRRKMAVVERGMRRNPRGSMAAGEAGWQLRGGGG